VTFIHCNFTPVEVSNVISSVVTFCQWFAYLLNLLIEIEGTTGLITPIQLSRCDDRQVSSHWPLPTPILLHSSYHTAPITKLADRAQVSYVLLTAWATYVTRSSHFVQRVCEQKSVLVSVAYLVERMNPQLEPILPSRGLEDRALVWNTNVFQTHSLLFHVPHWCWYLFIVASSLCVQTGSEAHPTSYAMGTGGPFPGAKARPGRNADHSPPSSAEVRTE
jgi:hypothetical protein